MRTLKTASNLASRAAETVKAAASAELYDQLIATTDRMREDAEQAIKTLEKIIARHDKKKR